MRRFALPLFALLFVAVPHAEASVIYEFHAERTEAGFTLLMDFVHTASGFITADTVVHAANLTSCTIGGTQYPGATCNLVDFDANPSFGTFFVNVLVNIPPSTALNYQHPFFEGSLAVVSDSDGYNTTNVLGGSARLKVTEVADPPVPEPTTLVLLATAAAGAFARRRRR
jgi:hypothetical protein